MDWVPWVLDIPVDVAQAKGFYADAGLTVKQTVPAGATDVVKFVSTGKAQFGLYYAPDTLMGVGRGRAARLRRRPHEPRPGRHGHGSGRARERRPTDLAGKMAGVVDDPVHAGLVRDHAEGRRRRPPASVKVVDPGFDLVAPLLAGKYDAVAVTEFGELVQADAGRAEARLPRLPRLGHARLRVPQRGDAAGVRRASTRRRCGRSSRRRCEGLDYAVAHPEEAVDLYVARHPELKKDLLLAQWKAAMPVDGRRRRRTRPAGRTRRAGRALDDWMVKTRPARRRPWTRAAWSPTTTCRRSERAADV